MIYFARRLSNGNIKIGSSQNVVERLKWLKVQYGEVEIIGIMDGGNKQEKILHKHFAAHNAGGDSVEWFYPVAELMEYITKHSKPFATQLPRASAATVLNAKLPVSESTLAMFKDFIAGLETTYDEAIRFMLSDYILSGERPLLAGKRHYDKFTDYLCKFVAEPVVPTITEVTPVGESAKPLPVVIQEPPVSKDDTEPIVVPSNLNALITPAPSPQAYTVPPSSAKYGTWRALSKNQVKETVEHNKIEPLPFD